MCLNPDGEADGGGNGLEGPSVRPLGPIRCLGGLRQEPGADTAGLLEHYREVMRYLRRTVSAQVSHHLLFPKNSYADTIACVQKYTS